MPGVDTGTSGNMTSARNCGDENYRAAFLLKSLPPGRIGAINRVKNNDPDLTEFSLRLSDVENFTNLAWELLGGYIADNDYVEYINLSQCRLTDSNVAPLFGGLANAGPLKKLLLSYNNFGIDGIRSMVPLLTNAPNLTTVRIGFNTNISTECFRILVEALQIGGTIEILRLSGCGIDDITALEHHTLTCLRSLYLNSNNNIHGFPSTMENYTNLESLWLKGSKLGIDGCRSIAKLLEKDGTRLKYLDVDSADMGDEEAGILATSLKNNTVLMELFLDDNKFGEEGFSAFLKLLNDTLSIERTYNSNHTLTFIGLPVVSKGVGQAKIQDMKNCIDHAININKRSEGGSHTAGRTKVIETQLQGSKRMELCHLQGICQSYDSIFAQIEPVFLPEVLALVGEKLGQNELYRMLMATIPDLASFADRREGASLQSMLLSLMRTLCSCNRARRANK